MKAEDINKAKELASSIMHKYYCENDVDGIVSFFADDISWVGAGEKDYLAGRKSCTEHFLKFRGIIQECELWDEEYNVTVPAEDLYIVTGRMWLAAKPGTQMFFKLHQRVTFVFHREDGELKCVHVHTSNPYEGMLEGEKFPEQMGRQSYAYVQERVKQLEEETRQQNRQLEVIMASVAGGLKISNDDEFYSYAFVSREAAALFGYTVEEFMEVTQGTAVGNVYPEDLPRVLRECQEAFRDGNLTYAVKYRVRCKDGSIKWIIDSGKKAQDDSGRWFVNSLYLDITESEEAAEKLREQSQLLTSIYDTVPCGIVRFLRNIDGEYTLLFMNKAALRLMGYTSEAESSADWKNGMAGTVLDEDRERILEEYSRMHQIGASIKSEYRVCWKDDSVHWMEAESTIVGVTSCGEDIFQRTVMDITERTMLHQRLEREQSLYRVAMEASTAIMFEYLIEEDLFISYEPQSEKGVICREIPQYSVKVEQGRIIHPDDVKTVLENICQGRTETMEIRCAAPGAGQGNYFWHRVNCRLLKEEGRPVRVVGALHNIHEMKLKMSENMERLSMNQSAFQAINGVYVSIFYVDLQKDSYYAVRLPKSERGMQLPRIGSYSGELVGFILEDTAEEKRDEILEVCDRRRLMEQMSEKNEHIELELCHKDRQLWLRMEIHLVEQRDGRPGNVIFAFRNISAEKQKELMYYEEERRTKEALEQAYEAANQANEAKSDFLSRMSHDIRTPINAIIGTAAIAEHYLGDAQKIGDSLEKIQTAGKHLEKLINEVLDMSKIESGKISLHETVFCLRGLVEEIKTIIQPDADKKGQTFLVDMHTLEHNSVCADDTRLRQILLNLLSNAVKYTGNGGCIKLTVEEKRAGDNKLGRFEFTVEDDGIGMTPDFLEKIFLPFERARDPRVEQVQGTGLGMPITRALVQGMGGNIQVESRPDQGSRFTVGLCIKLAGRIRTAGKETRGKKQIVFREGLRILAVEDNPVNLEILAELLELSGLQVESAVNGQEALDKFRQNPAGTFAAILMDIQMPVMDGYQATEQIRAMGESGERPDGAEIPIIALTANAFADDASRAKRAGMNEHVTKPLDVNHLMEVLDRYLSEEEPSGRV